MSGWEWILVGIAFVIIAALVIALVVGVHAGKAYDE